MVVAASVGAMTVTVASGLPKVAVTVTRATSLETLAE